MLKKKKKTNNKNYTLHIVGSVRCVLEICIFFLNFYQLFCCVLFGAGIVDPVACLINTSPSPRDGLLSRMTSYAKKKKKNKQQKLYTAYRRQRQMCIRDLYFFSKF